VIEVNPITGDVWVDGERVYLPGVLHDTLLALANCPGRPVPGMRLAPDYPIEGTHSPTASNRIWRLRQLLGKDAICNIPGRGYLLSRSALSP
jgi:hypothetical protein